MKANIKKIRKQRRYSVAFKKQMVQAFESGQYGVPQLERLHGVRTVQQSTAGSTRGSEVGEYRFSCIHE
jgi:transposase-like protein